MLQSFCLSGAPGHHEGRRQGNGPARPTCKSLPKCPLGQPPAYSPQARNATDSTCQGTQATTTSGGEIATRVGVGPRPSGPIPPCGSSGLAAMHAGVSSPADSTPFGADLAALLPRCGRRSASSFAGPLSRAATEPKRAERPSSGPLSWSSAQPGWRMGRGPPSRPIIAHARPFVKTPAGSPAGMRRAPDPAHAGGNGAQGAGGTGLGGRRTKKNARR